MPAKSNSPAWLSISDVANLNKDIVQKTGEGHVVLQPDLLGGAVARPQSLFEYEDVSDIIRLGVRLIEAIGKNHCFLQGNKRTAYDAGVWFMEINGTSIYLPDNEANAEMMRKLIIGETSAEEVEALFRIHAY